MNLLLGVFFTRKICLEEGNFFGNEIFRGHFYTGGISQNPYTKFVLLALLSFCRSNFTSGDIKDNCRNKISSGLNCLEDLSVGEANFFLEVEPNFLALFKNDQKLNKRNNFFLLKVRSNIRT